METRKHTNPPEPRVGLWGGRAPTRCGGRWEARQERATELRERSAGTPGSELETARARAQGEQQASRAAAVLPETPRPVTLRWATNEQAQSRGNMDIRLGGEFARN